MSLGRPTVALLLFTFDISPLCDVAQTSDCGTHCHLYSNMSPLCGVALTPDCGIVNLFLPFEASLQTPDWLSVILLGFWEDYHLTSFWLDMLCKFIIWVCIGNCSCASCLHLLYLMSELSCEYIQSTHLACWFGRIPTKVILWMKSTIPSPMPRGVPVSSVRSWNWSLVSYMLPLPK